MKRWIVVIVMLFAAPSQAQDGDSLTIGRLMQAISYIEVTSWYDETHVIEDVEAYADRERRVFAYMNWGREEIDWFRNVYSLMYDPHAYITDLAAMIDVLEGVP